MYEGLTVTAEAVVRLLADVEPLLDENERLRESLRQETARWELACRLLGERTAIEQAAMALYEHTRDPGYTGDEWDWPNIDRSYDKDDETETDPEWLRNRIRGMARVAIRAAVAAALAGPGPTPEPAAQAVTVPLSVFSSPVDIDATGHFVSRPGPNDDQPRRHDAECRCRDCIYGPTDDDQGVPHEPGDGPLPPYEPGDRPGPIRRSDA